MWSALRGATEKNSTSSDISLMIYYIEKPTRASKYGKISPQDVCFRDPTYYSRL